jgi:hypothetical protein
MQAMALQPIYFRKPIGDSHCKTSFMWMILKLFTLLIFIERHTFVAMIILRDA